MKRISILFVLIMALMLALTGCKCEHEWIEADCDTPKTCNLCQLTEGEPRPHEFAEADCVTPETCVLCGQTRGQTAPHPWLDANCQAPKTCEHCGATEGELGGHVWLDATTDAPKTCSLCAVTEGEKINTDPRFTTAATVQLQGIWACEYTFSGEELGIGEVLDEIPATLFIKMEPDGTFMTSVKVNDDGAYMAEITRITTEFVYDTYKTMEMDEEATKAEIMDTYGMTIEEYVEDLAARSARLRFEAYLEDGVYYAEGDQFFWAKGWNSEFVSGGFRFDEEENLVVDVLAIPEGGQPLTWFKVE